MTISNVNKRRVLFIHHGTGIGGAPISLANVITSIDQTRFDITIMTRQSDALILFENTGARIEICRHFPGFRHTTAGNYSLLNPQFWVEVLRNRFEQTHWQRTFERLKPDIVHLNSLTLLPLCRPAALAGAKVVVHVRETVVNGALGIRKSWMARHLSLYANAVIHISDFDHQLLNCKAPIVEVIPNWVDMNIFDRTCSGDKVRDELRLSSDQKLIVTFGGATRIKGTLDFLEAAYLLRERSDYVFCVVGLAPPSKEADSSRLKRLAKRVLHKDNRERIYSYVATHKLQDNVRFLGVRRDVPDILAASACLVFPATKAHQARPIFEAGSMAKPVIATDFDSIHEDVVHLHNGLLVTPSSPQALKNAVVKLLDTPQMMQAMGEANYHMVLQRHNKLVNASRIQKIYDQLLDKPHTV